MTETHDVLIIGAGTGGSIAARFAAKSGLDVCLIDRKPREAIGDKICGDAVGNEIFDYLNIPHPKNEELSCHIKGAKLYPPSMNSCLTLIDPKQAGYIVNRLEFGQRLLNEALDAGVKNFLDETMALDLIYKDKKVAGVKVKTKNMERKELRANLIFDASGVHSPIRKKIQSPLVENDILKEDMILCFREIVSFPLNDQEIMDPEYISIILDQEKAPGGYIWYFPKNEQSVNLGLGTFLKHKNIIKQYYKDYVFKHFIKSSRVEILSSGGGVVPVRRPLWSCVEDSIMFVGDAACLVNPLHGGGIDPSMRAGYMAAQTAILASEEGDFSKKGLWKYNYDIMTTLGAEFAPLDLLRIVLQVLSNEELNFGLERNLLTGDEILEISSTGVLNLSIMDFAVKAFKGITHPNLLLDLNYLRLRMEEIAKHYKHFPQSFNLEEFNQWKEKTIQIYDNLIKIIIKSRNKDILLRSELNG
ncbi:MAG: geranylgeranyl reductase family protein [Promethearchaeota archaeon]